MSFGPLPERVRRFTRRAASAPAVSVVVAFWNAEAFLAEAIESVLAQTFADWELLLVDDGSTDGSGEIARRYAQAHAGKIHCLEHEGHRNRGVSASRNLGAAHASGRWIALLDADDVWLPQKLERQVFLLESHPEVGIVWGKQQYWHSWRQPATRADYVREPNLPSGRAIAPPELLLRCYPLGQGVTPCPSDMMVRREAWTRVGGFEQVFDGPRIIFEDQAFLAKIYLSERVWIADECWIKYRKHPASATGQAGKRQLDDVRTYYFDWLERYLAVRGVTDEAIWQAVRSARRGRPSLWSRWFVRNTDRG